MMVCLLREEQKWVLAWASFVFSHLQKSMMEYWRVWDGVEWMDICVSLLVDFFPGSPYSSFVCKTIGLGQHSAVCGMYVAFFAVQ